ncbi:MAG: hypothetical protein ACLT98_06850 [Eggerthellaceae bacterium]
MGKILRLKEICDKALTCAPRSSCVVVRRIEKTHGHEGGARFQGRRLPEAPQCEPERWERTIPVHPLHERQHGETEGHPTAPAAICFTPPSPRSTCSTKEHDIFWCTADAGWIGHSYLVTGCCRTERRRSCSKAPQLLSLTVSGRSLRFGVNILYTALTAGAHDERRRPL